MTDEQTHGIIEEPEQSCPTINLIVEAVTNIEKLAKEPSYGWNGWTKDELESRISEIEWNVYDLKTKLEEVREIATAIRNWGQEWKNNALWAHEKLNELEE